MPDWFTSAFQPRVIAVFGASNTPGKHGFVLMNNLAADFAGDIHPVHPRDTAVCSRPAVRSLAEIKAPIDLAVIATPPNLVAPSIHQCIDASVAVAVVISGGFAETGEPGAKMEQRFFAEANPAGLRIIGPNSFGLINTDHGLNLSFGLGLPKRGGISLVTQSGAYCMAALTRSQAGEMGFAKILALGNKTDIDETAALSRLGEDSDTQVIALLVEDIKDGRAFFEALRKITPKKPVVVLKTGRGDAAKRAAQSHTAALANEFSIVEAMLRQAGARVVKDGQHLFDAAAALALQPAMSGNRVAMISNSGGTAVELTDLLEESGFEVPRLSPDLRRRIAVHLPAQGNAGNPIDVATDWPRFPDAYGFSLKTLLESDQVDAVIPILLQRSAIMPEVTERIIATISMARRAGCNKTVQVCWVAGPEADANYRRLWAHGIPCHRWPVRSAQAMAAALELRIYEPCHRRISGPAKPDLPADDDWLTADRCFELLERWQLPVAPWRYVESSDELCSCGHALEFPVVLKAIRRGLVHKSDASAVRLDIQDCDALNACARELDQRLGTGPYLLQKQMTPGIELLLGAFRDPCFGPVLVFGVGGVLTDVVADRVMRLCPIGTDEALKVIESIRSQSLLTGFRGFPPVRTKPLAALIARFSQWIAGSPWIVEIDLNPIIVDGNRLSIVDARVRVETEPGPAQPTRRLSKNRCRSG